MATAKDGPHHCFVFDRLGVFRVAGLSGRNESIYYGVHNLKGNVWKPTMQNNERMNHVTVDRVILGLSCCQRMMLLYLVV